MEGSHVRLLLNGAATAPTAGCVLVRSNIVWPLGGEEDGAAALRQPRHPRFRGSEGQQRLRVTSGGTVIVSVVTTTAAAHRQPGYCRNWHAWPMEKGVGLHTNSPQGVIAAVKKGSASQQVSMSTATMTLSRRWRKASDCTPTGPTMSSRWWRKHQIGRASCRERVCVLV